MVKAHVGSVESSREGDRVTTLELFFDLVYVFAFTQVSSLMAHGQAPRSLVEGFVILSLLWWSWCSFTWLANEARADRGVLQVAFVVVMGAMFLASLSIPESFHDLDGGLSAPLVLVACYAATRLTHLAFYAVAAAGDRALQRQLGVTLVGSVLPVIALLTIGALADEHRRLWIWLAAVLYDFAIVFITSGRGSGWAVRSAAHFTERHGLVVILALGESVVAIGVGVAGEPLTGPTAIGAMLAIGIAVGLWYAYFGWLADRIEERIGAQTGNARSVLATQVCTYGHLPIVAGVILTALGIEQAMGHLAEHHLGRLGAWSLAAGLALVLTSTAAVAMRAGLGTLLVRLGGATMLLAVASFLAHAAPLHALAIVLGVLVMVCALERTPSSRHQKSEAFGSGRVSEGAHD